MSKTKKKKNFIVFLSDYFKSVVAEWKKVVKPTKANLIKYSVATLSFMVIICLFFMITDLIIVLLSYVKGLIS